MGRLKKILQKILAALARRIVNKYRPKIIGITGSMGKTSAKEAVFLVVAQKFRARRSLKNFNTEFGLPFSVIGVDNPGRNIFKWLAVLAKAGLIIIFPVRYPEVLILEMGVEFPGDMDDLVKIVRPNIAVITGIGLSHNEFFNKPEDIAVEKGKLAAALGSDDILLLNADNDLALAQASKSRAKVLSYGQSESADIRAENIVENLEQEKYRTTLTVRHGDEAMDVAFHGIGKPHIQAIICAVALGFLLNVEKDLIRRGLSGYKPTPGRLNIFAGLKHSTIIDDTYNASPDSMKEALSVLGRFPASYKLAVLGDMLELGNVSEREHRAIGSIVPTLNVNRLVTIGPGGKQIAASAISAGMPEGKVSAFETADAAKSFVRNLVEPDSVILLKGSQGMRLEKITKEIMAEPMRAVELLCRQYGKWLEA